MEAKAAFAVLSDQLQRADYDRRRRVRGCNTASQCDGRKAVQTHLTRAYSRAAAEASTGSILAGARPARAALLDERDSRQRRPFTASAIF